MWSVQRSAETKASPTLIWSILVDTSCWYEWIEGVEFSTIHGPVKEGTWGTIKGRNGRRTHFIISEVQPGRFVVTRSRLPLAWISYVFDIIKTPDGTIVVHRIEVTGPLSYLYGRLMTKKLESKAASNLSRLIAYAQECMDIGKTKAPYAHKPSFREIQI